MPKLPKRSSDHLPGCRATGRTDHTCDILNYTAIIPHNVGNAKSCVAFWTIGSPLSTQQTSGRQASVTNTKRTVKMTSSLLTEIGEGGRGPPHLHGRFNSWQFAALRMGQLVLPGKQNIRKRGARKSIPRPLSEDRCPCQAASVFWQSKQQDTADFPCIKKRGLPLQNLGNNRKVEWGSMATAKHG